MSKKTLIFQLISLNMSSKKGRYSGSIRLDPKEQEFEEPDVDNEFTKDMWLTSGDVQEDPDFKRECKEKIDQWKRAVAITADPDEIIVHSVGESHIDCAWLWRYEQTREKAYKTFKKACDHADLFPNKFNFALSEPLLLEWVKEDHPDTFKRIQEKVKSRNIELVGGSYVEPDCMMPSGEAFCRMRLYGMRFLRENFGILPKVEWFLDSFGYNWGIPQILTKSGAKYFWTTKITWNYDTVFPFVDFWWQGPDGSRILTANFPMGTGSLDRWVMYEIGRHPLKPDGQKVWDYTYNYEDLVDHIEEDEICGHVGNFFGKGDGGHGPTHQEVATNNEYCKYDMFQWSRVHTLYEELEKASDRFPVWNDELYLENHRGTFSVHAEVKRHNRKNENALINHETLALITSLLADSYEYPFDTFEWGWKTTLKNQFHDTLPGSSIPEVYDDCWDDWVEQENSYRNIVRNVGKALSNAQQSDESPLSPNKQQLYLFNPVAWERTNVVFIPVDVLEYPLDLSDDEKPNYAILKSMDDGAEYICQPVGAEPEGTIERKPAGWYAVPKLGAIKLTPFELTICKDNESESLKASASPLKTDGISAENGSVRLKLDESTGAFLELTVDGVNDGKNVLKGDQSNLTFAWEDRPKNWPAWNLEHYWNYPLDVKQNKNVNITIEEEGPVFITMSIAKTIIDNQITQKVSLFKDCDGVYLEYLTDWKTPKRLLKILYSTSTNAEFSVSDIAYGAIKRKTKPETPCDKARFEKIMHKYCDLSTPDNKWGVAMINEGKYAFDTEADNESMRLTMLRSPQYPNPAGEAWVIKERKFNKKEFDHEVPEYSGLGPFKCRYMLLAHPGGCLITDKGEPNEVVKQSAEEFNQPVIIIPTNGLKEDVSAHQLLEIQNPNVYLGTLKLNEWEKNGSVVVRFVEGCGIDESEANIKFGDLLASKIKSIREVDILERQMDSEFDWDANSGLLKFKMGKFEIKTFEFEI